jgi:Leucine-rich repeat (LRR) protein
LEENAFIKRGYTVLETLDLSHNNISDISPYAFTGFDAMKRLILRHNNLLALQQDVFEPLINLRELYLQRNKLSIILPQTVSPLNNLINLDLRHNKLTDIDEETFTNLSVLQELRLIGNVLKTFAPEIFNPLKNLQYLDLQLFETPHEQEILAPSKSEVTTCLCKRKKALDWCHERHVNCLVTCSYSHESQYDKDSNICLNLLNAFSETKTAKNRTDTSNDLLWAVAITIGVIFLLFITIIILALLFLKSTFHTGDENCSVVSNSETFNSHTPAAEDE